MAADASVKAQDRRLFEAEVRRLIDEARPSVKDQAEDPRGAEKRRLAAIRWLLEVRRVQIGEAGESAVDPEIRDFFARVATRIWSAPDPAAAMDLFMHGRKSQSRQSRRKARAFAIVAAVLAERSERKTRGWLAAALKKVADDPPRGDWRNDRSTSVESVKKLYLKYRRDVERAQERDQRVADRASRASRAAIAMERLEAGGE